MIFLRVFWLNVVRGKPVDTEVERIMRAATDVYLLPQAKVKVSGIRDNCHCPAWRLLIGVLARVFTASLQSACLSTRPTAPSKIDKARTGAATS